MPLNSFDIQIIEKNDTAQKMKFLITDFSANVTNAAVFWGFGHIY